MEVSHRACPAIVIVAFNRPKSLLRLLGSVAKAEYPEGELVPLCLCIDYQDSKENRTVVEIAETFEWPFGPKDVIHQSENLGLKQHVLTCGDLTERFGSMIMLEDDLYVSPAFYDYAARALDYYEDEDRVGGVSLYGHKINVSGQLPFESLNDGNDVYFLQIAASWGQAWSQSQWRAFRDWFIFNTVVPNSALMPDYIINWPATSWLKHYVHFLVDTNRYFVYPKIALSTNFSDAGQHNAKGVPFFQVPLVIVKSRYRFESLSVSNAVYDSFFEILPSRLSLLNYKLERYDYTVNLYGLKSKMKCKSKFVLVSRKVDENEMSFALSLKPMADNIIFDLKGIGVSLVDVENLDAFMEPRVEERKYHFEYNNRVMSFQEKMRNIVDSVLLKVMN
ncbi:MAG: hypothetical protein ACJAXB_002004 [Candidatus Endobugula sp.]|jgi:hypothetical protein